MTNETTMTYPTTPRHRAADTFEREPEEVDAREDLAGHLCTIAAELESMFGIYLEGDHGPDLLAADEYPFHRSLEDLAAEVRHAAELVTSRDADLTETVIFGRPLRDTDV